MIILLEFLNPFFIILNRFNRTLEPFLILLSPYNVKTVSTIKVKYFEVNSFL